MYRPTTSRTLPTNAGSVLSFQVWMACGLRPKARQIRETDYCDSHFSAAIAKVSVENVADRSEFKDARYPDLYPI
jgi:hypothetical protein